MNRSFAEVKSQERSHHQIYFFGYQGFELFENQLDDYLPILDISSTSSVDLPSKTSELQMIQIKNSIEKNVEIALEFDR
jgi:hypothetical protein